MKNHVERIETVLKNPKLYYYNPILYRYYLAINTINNYFEKEENIIIWGGGIHTCQLFKGLSSANREKIIYIIDKNITEDIYETGKKYILPEEILKLEISTIFISSFRSREEIRRNIQNLNKEYRVIDIYEILKDKGIEFNSEFYSEVEISYFQISNDLNKLSVSINNEEKIFLYKKLVGEYFHIKDFINAFEFIQKIINIKGENYKFYHNIRQYILTELEELKEVINRKDHIVLNWMDALRPDEVCNMPFLNSLKDKGLYFENAHTVTPYTSATLKTIFKNELYLDDYLYKIQNLEELEDSKLYKLLLEKKYTLKYYGAKCNKGIFFNKNTIAYFSMKSKVYEISMCLWQWELLRDLEKSEKYFAIIHMIAETHCPNLNGIQKKIKSIDESDIYRVYNNCNAQDVETIKTQIRESQKYVDTCFKFYFSFYINVRYNIILSDHGQYRGEKPVCFKGHTKVFFLIMGKLISKRKESGLFSLCNFSNIIQSLLENKENRIKYYTSDYVLIQSDDCYSTKIFDRYNVNKEAYKEFYIQHRGVICLEDSYLQMISGEEYYFIEGEESNQIYNTKYSERIKKLKYLAGNKYINIYQEEKYKYSRKLYEIFEINIDNNINFLE